MTATTDTLQSLRPVEAKHVPAKIETHVPLAADVLSVDDAIDMRFDVPFTHRLRFTQDVLGGPDAKVLLDLLERDAGRPARVLVVLESAMDETLDLSGKFRELAAQAGGVIDLLEPLRLDGGEVIKNDPNAILPALQSILNGNIDRRNYVVAVGGGAFLDAVGLAAALAHRGIRLIRLPTTIMGQADSGVGVKNAINFFGKKNWLGSFGVPWAVINDRALLGSLPDRDWRCGFAEAVKVSLLKEPEFFDRLCVDAEAIASRDWAAADPVIRRSAYWHLMHITRGGDPFETREARPLDFGHWAAHRLESLSGFTIRHGEAVGIGLAIDCVYSTYAHGLPVATADRVIRCLRELGLPLSSECLDDIDGLMSGLEEFRQHLGGRLTVTMLRDVGRPLDVHEVDNALMRRAIEQVNIGMTD